MAKKGKILIILAFLVPGLWMFAGGEKNRDYLRTGNWYPPTTGELNNLLDGYFSRAKPVKIPGKILGLIAPHAGLAHSGRCSAAAYRQLDQLPRVERVILLGVSHRSRFYGACVSGFDYNTTPLGKIPVDKTITSSLAREKYFKIDDRVMQYEHSLENQLPFLQKALEKQDFKIVPILFGMLNRDDFQLMADTIKKYVDDKTLVVVSTDLTHYGRNFNYTPFKKDVAENLARLDKGMIDHIVNLDFPGYYGYMQKTGITMCGFTPVGVMIKMFAGGKNRGYLMDYYKSGDAGGNYSLSVSYASIAIASGGKDKSQARPGGMKKEDPGPMILSTHEKKTLLAIARESLSSFLERGDVPGDLEKRYEITSHLKKVSGVFVTLKIAGQLRGCIGTIVGLAPLYQGVRDNAVKSGVSDYRFPRVRKSELEKIDFEISVMTPLQEIEDYKKIRLGTDGVIIRKGRRQAVYLPQVATETGWNLDEFLSSLCQKAGLRGGEYKVPGMEFFIFQALVFGEKELHE